MNRTFIPKKIIALILTIAAIFSSNAISALAEDVPAAVQSSISGDLMPDELRLGDLSGLSPDHPIAVKINMGGFIQTAYITMAIPLNPVFGLKHSICIKGYRQFSEKRI